MPLGQDTLPLDGPTLRRPASSATRKRTADLMRIVRHALLATTESGPLDRAIRSAARMDGSLPEADEDMDGRARLLAGRIDSLLAGLADPHRETVRD